VVDLAGERPCVTFRDPAVGETYSLAVDRLVLSAGILGGDSAADLTRGFKIPADEDGFLLEAHIKLRPVDFATDGMFMCGLAHAPKTMGESIGQALAAAARAAGVLSKEYLILAGSTAEVNADACAACMTCARVCPYGVPRMDDDKRAMVIDPASCHGCGSCAAACPVRAISLGHYKTGQLLAALDGLNA
jgi:heterodisulfide reductase subunit A